MYLQIYLNLNTFSIDLFDFDILMIFIQGGPEIEGVYVKQVQRESAAELDGRIKKGEYILQLYF